MARPEARIAGNINTFFSDQEVINGGLESILRLRLLRRMVLSECDLA